MSRQITPDLYKLYLSGETTTKRPAPKLQCTKVPIPVGSFHDLCQSDDADDWVCSLEIDFFHAQITINAVCSFVTSLYHITSNLSTTQTRGRCHCC